MMKEAISLRLGSRWASKRLECVKSSVTKYSRFFLEASASIDFSAPTDSSILLIYAKMSMTVLLSAEWNYSAWKQC